MSKAEETLAQHLSLLGVKYEREYTFHPRRKWRFDFAFPEHKVAAEVEGGVWTRGRHTRGAGFVKDAEKYNEAALLGWRVLRFTPREHVKTGIAVQTILRAIGDDSEVDQYRMSGVL